MANLEDTPQWDEIYQIDINDPVQGGEHGLSNVQAQQLANRTAMLKQRLDEFDTDIYNALDELENDLNNEITARGNADEALGLAQAAETSARQSADNALSNAINQESINRTFGDDNLFALIEQLQIAVENIDTGANAVIYRVIDADVAMGEYTLLDDDKGKVLIYSGEEPLQVICPEGLDPDTKGFKCEILQKGDGDIEVVSDGTSVVVNGKNEFAVKGPNFVVTVFTNNGSEFTVWGETKPGYGFLPGYNLNESSSTYGNGSPSIAALRCGLIIIHEDSGDKVSAWKYNEADDSWLKKTSAIDYSGKVRIHALAEDTVVISGYYLSDSTIRVVKFDPVTGDVVQQATTTVDGKPYASGYPGMVVLDDNLFLALDYPDALSNNSIVRRFRYDQSSNTIERDRHRISLTRDEVPISFSSSRAWVFMKDLNLLVNFYNESSVLHMSNYAWDLTDLLETPFEPLVRNTVHPSQAYVTFMDSEGERRVTLTTDAALGAAGNGYKLTYTSDNGSTGTTTIRNASNTILVSEGPGVSIGAAILGMTLDTSPLIDMDGLGDYTDPLDTPTDGSTIVLTFAGGVTSYAYDNDLDLGEYDTVIDLYDGLYIEADANWYYLVQGMLTNRELLILKRDRIGTDHKYVIGRILDGNLHVVNDVEIPAAIEFGGSLPYYDAHTSQGNVVYTVIQNSTPALIDRTIKRYELVRKGGDALPDGYTLPAGY